MTPEKLAMLDAIASGQVYTSQQLVAFLAADAARVIRVIRAMHAERYEVEQALGKALQYPECYPLASGVDDGAVCIGDHTAITLAHEAATKLVEQRNYIDAVTREGRV